MESSIPIVWQMSQTLSHSSSKIDGKVIEAVKCAKCNDCFHPSSLRQSAAASKSAACKHVSNLITRILEQVIKIKPLEMRLLHYTGS